MAAMVATVVMVLTVSTYAITARAVNPVVGLSFQGTTAVCHAKCFAGSDSDNIQATLSRGCRLIKDVNKITSSFCTVKTIRMRTLPFSRSSYI